MGAAKAGRSHDRRQKRNMSEKEYSRGSDKISARSRTAQGGRVQETQEGHGQLRECRLIQRR